MTASANSLPAFYHLLSEAQYAAKEVDNFDLRSEDPTSVSKFSVLRSEQATACLALVAYVTQNAKGLTEQIAAEMLE